MAGAALGIFLAWGGLKALVAALPARVIPSEAVIELNAPVLTVTLGKEAGVTPWAWRLPHHPSSPCNRVSRTWVSVKVASSPRTDWRFERGSAPDCPRAGSA